MSKIYKIAYYAVALIVIAFIAKVVKISFFEHEDFEFFSKLLPVSTQTEYQSVKLGKSMDEMLYEKGHPTHVYVEITDRNDERIPKFIRDMEPFTSYLHGISKKELEENNQQYKKYDVWVYQNGASGLGVFFDKHGNVKEVSCYDVEDTKIEQIEKWRELEKNCSIYGLTIHAKEDDVIKKLGTPNKVTLEDTVKIIDYKKLNLQIRLEKKAVFFIALRNDL